MHIAAIALGSNLASPLGDRAANLREAVSRIRALGHIRAVSSFHSTAPVGYTDQPDFLNAALLLETTLEPLALMHALLAIEHAMGRDRATVPAKGPRIIDLDLLLMDNLVLNHPGASNTDPGSEAGDEVTPALTLPHPALAQRRFVLAPLAEIAPAMLDPTSGLTIVQLLARLSE